MRVTHIAGYRPMIDTIIARQKARSLSIREVATRELNYSDSIKLAELSRIMEAEKASSDIIHIHDPAAFFDLSAPQALSDIDSVLRSATAGPAKIVVSLDGDVLAPADLDLTRLDSLCACLKEHIACVFIGSAEWAEMINRLDNWSWLPNPIDVTAVPAPANYDPNRDKTRILHLAFSHALDDSKRIIDKLKSLCASDNRFVLTVAPVKDFESIDELRRTLSEHDVIVERISRPMYGWAALEGMAHGKTVLSGIHPQHRKEWQQLEFSPVLDSHEDNLIQRLQSLAQEPRSMRDIGRRSRNFVENYHNADQIVAMMVEIYETL